MNTIVYKVKKGLNLIRLSFQHRIGVCSQFLDSIFRIKRIIKNIIEDTGIKVISIEPYRIKKWHNGNAIFIVADNKGEKYFVKWSKRVRSIIAESNAINLLKNELEQIGVYTCDIICEYKTKREGIIVEKYVKANPLWNKKFIENMSLEKKKEIVNILNEVVKVFHENNFIHADFTPKNIIIDNDGKIYIIDFEFSFMPDVDIPIKGLSKEKIKNIGFNYGMGTGIADDGYSLMQLSKYLIPDLIREDYDLWKKINLQIGKMQVNFFTGEIVYDFLVRS